MAGCTLLHISDLHFGRAYARRMGDAVLAASERIRPDAVVVSGDLVEWAENVQAWRDVAAFLGQFRAPVLAVPGNHDIDRANLLGRFSSPFRAWRKHVHADVDRALPLSGAHVIGVASPSRWTMDLGYVSRAQADWARDSFDRAPQDALRVLVIHHGPRAARAGRWLRTHLRGGRFEKMLFESEVDLVLSGHRHFPHAEEIACGDTGREALWLQAGTTTCWRVNRRTHANSFTVVRSQADRMEVGWWYYDDAARGFEPGEHKVFARGARVGLLAQPASAVLSPA